MNGPSDAPIWLSVSIDKLLAILVALTFMLAPTVARAGEMAMADGHHDMVMMDGGHCQKAPSHSPTHDKAAGDSCCVSMCMAVAIAPGAPIESTRLAHVDAYFAAPATWHGYLGEIATPPPRLA